MNLRRFLVAVLAIFIFALVWNGLVHMFLLKEANLALENVARPAAERNMVLGLFLTAGVATLFVYSYVSFVHTPGLKRALGHSAFFALLAGLLIRVVSDDNRMITKKFLDSKGQRQARKSYL